MDHNLELQLEQKKSMAAQAQKAMDAKFNEQFLGAGRLDLLVPYEQNSKPDGGGQIALKLHSSMYGEFVFYVTKNNPNAVLMETERGKEEITLDNIDEWASNEDFLQKEEFEKTQDPLKRRKILGQKAKIKKMAKSYLEAAKQNSEGLKAIVELWVLEETKKIQAEIQRLEKSKPPIKPPSLFNFLRKKAGDGDGDGDGNHIEAQIQAQREKLENLNKILERITQSK